MAIGCTAGWLLQPWVSAIFNGISYIGNTAMAILAFVHNAARTVHGITPALGIWPGMAFVAVSDGPGINKTTMFLMNRL